MPNVQSTSVGVFERMLLNAHVATREPSTLVQVERPSFSTKALIDRHSADGHTNTSHLRRSSCVAGSGTLAITISGSRLWPLFEEQAGRQAAGRQAGRQRVIFKHARTAHHSPIVFDLRGKPGIIGDRFGTIDGLGKWNKTNLNQWKPCISILNINHFLSGPAKTCPNFLFATKTAHTQKSLEVGK